MTTFEILSGINVNGHTESKNGLTYLSWAWAWAEVKKKFPGTVYRVYENTLPNGYVVNYFTDGRTAYVKTGIEIEGVEYVEMLPVMDYRNASIPVEKMTSMDVNKAIQRSLTKAVARHGLGLYIYAGEDIPEEPMLDMAIVEELREKLNPTQVASYLKYFKVHNLQELTEGQARAILQKVADNGK